jgi:hypothetical protein
MLLTAQVWECPVETNAQRSELATGAGLSLAAWDCTPSWPVASAPQQYSLSASSMPHVWESPALTLTQARAPGTRAGVGAASPTGVNTDSNRPPHRRILSDSSFNAVQTLTLWPCL